jgi:hypothetical protein
VGNLIYNSLRLFLNPNLMPATEYATVLPYETHGNAKQSAVGFKLKFTPV